MRKVCVFVEGQTELIFVREFLLKWYEYKGISIACYQLIGNDTLPAEYDYPMQEADVHYQLVNVGNDNRVLSWLLNRVGSLKSEGYDMIIGLRDMYCEFYRKKSRTINLELNQQIIDNVQEQIVHKLADDKSMVAFHFAIMEIESWMLAMHQSLLKKFTDLRVDDINEIYDIQACIDSSIYHPAEVLDQVFQLSDSRYEKHKTDANSILSYMSKEDFNLLYNSARSQSFNSFVDTLLGRKGKIE